MGGDGSRGWGRGLRATFDRLILHYTARTISSAVKLKIHHPLSLSFSLSLFLVLVLSMRSLLSHFLGDARKEGETERVDGEERERERERERESEYLARHAAVAAPRRAWPSLFRCVTCGRCCAGPSGEWGHFNRAFFGDESTVRNETREKLPIYPRPTNKKNGQRWPLPADCAPFPKQSRPCSLVFRWFFLFLFASKRGSFIAQPTIQNGNGRFVSLLIHCGTLQKEAPCSSGFYRVE